MAAKGLTEYDLILLGATGFTGKLCAEHITRSLPTDLKWAVAGRNHKKLSSVVNNLKSINPDRKPPAIEVAELSSHDLDKLVQKTRVVITTIGPYNMYGTPVIEACAKSGTHYLDCTGETPWVYDMIQKYHETAKRNKAVLIPLCGIESAPADIVAYVLASHIRRKLSSGTSKITHSIQAFAGATSGGTFLSAITIFDAYSMDHLRRSASPLSMIASQPPTVRPQKSTSYKLLGWHNVPGLGLLSDSLCGAQDMQLVYRTWSLLDSGNYYGRNFTYTAWMRAKTRISAFMFHYTMAFAVVSLALFKPLRWLLRRIVKQPGEGPTKELQGKHFVAFKALATAESDPSRGAVCKMNFKGDLYIMTGILLAEAAMVLLRPDPHYEHWVQKLEGGVLTPATLGDQFVERLQNAGLAIDVSLTGEEKGSVENRTTRPRL